MSRTIPMWIADHDDQAIPTRVKARVFERCAGRCAITDVKLGPGTPFDFDHIIPLAIGGEHSEANLQVVCREAHRAKTACDVSIKSKVARVRAKHLGIWPASKRPLKSRGFSPVRAALRDNPNE